MKTTLDTEQALKELEALKESYISMARDYTAEGKTKEANEFFNIKYGVQLAIEALESIAKDS